jgi:ABC-type nitrate/sulfonate/bicarbonate transport system permease component
MPVVAFVPLTIIRIDTDDTQKYAIIWIGTFFQQVLMAWGAQITASCRHGFVFVDESAE